MEFKGRIVRLFKTREGVSARTGNAWKSLPFVFEYHENETDRYADSVLLETIDKDIMGKIAQFVEKDAEGRAVIANGEMRLTKMVEARCGFGHSTRMYDGRCYNDVRLYRMEVMEEPAENAAGTGAGLEPLGEASGTVAEEPAANAAGKGADGKPLGDTSGTGAERQTDSFAELKPADDGDDLPF